MRLRWTEDAFGDLREISKHIADRKSPAVAARICRSIYTAIQGLRRFPSKGRLGRRAFTRELVVPGSPYFVVYRLHRETIEIVRIIHGAREYPPVM